MATKAQVEALKRRHRLALLRTPGVSGVGVGREDDADDYVLVVYLTANSAATRAKVNQIVGANQPLKMVRSGRFGPQ